MVSLTPRSLAAMKSGTVMGRRSFAGTTTPLAWGPVTVVDMRNPAQGWTMLGENGIRPSSLLYQPEALARDALPRNNAFGLALRFEVVRVFRAGRSHRPLPTRLGFFW